MSASNVQMELTCNEIFLHIKYTQTFIPDAPRFEFPTYLKNRRKVSYPKECITI